MSTICLRTMNTYSTGNSINTIYTKDTLCCIYWNNDNIICTINTHNIRNA